MRPLTLSFVALAVILAEVLLPGCGNDDNPAKPRLPAAFTFDAGTLALWHMDEGTGQQVPNSAGPVRTLYLGLDGTAEAADPTWTSPGFNGIGSLLAFDEAQSEFARAGDGFPFPNDWLTVEFLVRTSYASNMPNVFATDNVSIYIWITPAGFVQFDVGDGSNWGTSTTSSVAIADGAWHYVACTYDHAVTRVYIDGIERGATAQVLDVGDASSVYVGGRPSNTFLDGELDEVRISMVPRTAGEIDAFQKSR